MIEYFAPTPKGHKYYVGINKGVRAVFSAATTPTEQTHGSLYGAVVGPFKTKQAAYFMAQHGQGNNPHLQHVNDAERLVKNQYTN